MMNKLFHPVTLCFILFSIALFGQNWYSDEDFLTYYGPDEEVALHADITSMNIYLNPNHTYHATHLAKAKGFIGLNKSKNMVSIDMTSFKDVNLFTIAPPQLAKLLDIDYSDLHEVVPTVRVNGRIEATLKSDFIVKFNSSLSSKYLESLLQRLEGEVITTNPDGAVVIRMNKIKNGFDLMHEVAALGMIEYAQPDMIVAIQHTDDPLFSKQYQLQNNGQYIDGQKTTSGIDLNVTPAWNTTKGSGITVAVIDDGIESHEDLPSIKIGFTPADNGNGSPSVTGKHGMAVAGIISAQHNNLGIKGIAPNAELIGVNIFAQGTSLSDYARSFYWAVENGADVINNSWGFIYENVDVESVNPPIYTVRKGAMCSTNPFPALTSAINYAADHGRNGKGCIITFAAGNWAQEGPLGQNSDECVTYPSSLDKVLSIGAINPQGEKSIYSDYGPKLDFVAPSNDLNSSGSRSYFGVRTIDREGAKGYSRSNYHSGFGGTSAATPAATGAIALVLSAHPDLTREELVALLRISAKDVGTAGFDTKTGYGLIDAAAAIAAGGNVIPIDPCEQKGGDSDNDGICDAEDCAPFDASFPARAGSACNDNDASTKNDKVTANGCGCEGETIACYDAGGDLDGDGYCFLDDCDDENPLVPASVGSACNDNDPNTDNDSIQADGCTCQGTIPNDENNNQDDNNNDNNEDSEGDQEQDGCIAPSNIAREGTVSQSSTFFTFSADRTIDGDIRKSRYAQTNYTNDPYLDLDLNTRAELQKINVFLKATPRSPISVYVSESQLSGKTLDEIKSDDAVLSFEISTAESVIELNANGRYIRLQTGGFQSLAIVEIEVYGCHIDEQISGLDLGFENIKGRPALDDLIMNAYPNPTSDNAFIAFDNGFGKAGVLSIYNSIGVKIYHESMDQIPLIPVHINMTSLQNGMYIIELISENQRLTQKLLLNK
ncbi:MAG: S8/S53 family peptidase [Saprospiraceae bacterium]